MGCSSSSSVHKPSKKDLPIEDDLLSFQRQLNAHPSASSIKCTKDTQTSVPSLSYLVARHAYSADGDLQVDKGAVLNLGEKGKGEGYWSEVVTQKGEKLHIPNSYLATPGSLQCNDWYHESLSKYEAEKKLSQQELQPGTFLIHKKPHNSDYICSTLTERGVSHYVIRQEDGSYFITRRRLFTSVGVLVEMFMSDDRDIPFRLNDPLPPVPPVVYSRYGGVEFPIEVPPDGVELVKKISGGHSSVWEGNFNGKPVAVRTFNSENSPDHFRNSFLRLRSIHHKNLQLVIGMCCQESELFLVTEHFSRGPLKEYLVRDGSYLTESDLIHLAAQISNGMCYLELSDFTHGQLTAHNVMLGSDDLLKICDVGTRAFVQSKEKCVRWTAFEVFLDKTRISIKSDVWSFGMLMMEVVTLGGDPFPNLQNSEVETQVLEGYQMPKPAECHEYLYELMKECWNKKPEERPTFDSLTYRLDDFYISAEHESNPRQSIYRYIK